MRLPINAQKHWTSLLLSQSLYGRTDGRTDRHTLTSQPKFFGLIGYQICLAMELHWQAWPTGSAVKETDELYRCTTAVHERKRLSLVVLVNKNQSHHVKFK